MTVERFEDRHIESWDEYVAKHPEAAFFHRIGWKRAIERAYGLKSIYHVATNGEGIIGILPAFEVRHLSQGKCLVSLPFSPIGGVCADDVDALQALLARLVEVSRESDVKYWEIRQQSDSLPDLNLNDQYVTSLLRLDRDSDKVWSSFRSEIRNRVRKAGKAGMSVRSGGADLLPAFYKVYSEHMHELGTPAHCFAFLQAIVDEFPDTTRVFLVELNDEPVGGMFVIFHKKLAINMWTSCLSAYAKASPNNLLYWEVIKYAAEQGYEYFDFGRSVLDSGPFVFKKRWGTEHRPLFYQYYLNKAGRVPSAIGTGKSEGLFVKVWKKLPPVVTNRLGPVLRKHIP